MKRFLYLIFVFLFQSPACSFAVSSELFAPTPTDTTRIEEVVISENRFDIPLSQYNRNVEVLNAEDIKLLPGQSINEKLIYLNGVDIRQRGPFGTQADISIDGGSFEQTTILLNGVKINDPQTAHHSLNIPIPLEAIQRIEVLRGPASRVYGINSLTGAINIITKSIENSGFYVNSYTGSSFEDRKQEDKSGLYYGHGLTIGGHIATGKHGQQLYINQDKSNGQRYNSASRAYRVYYNGDYRYNKNNHLTAQVGYIYNEFGANGFYAAPGDRESEELVKTVITSISNKHIFSSKWMLNSSFANRYNEDDYRYFRYDLASARSIHYNNVFSSEVNTRYSSRVGDFGLGMEVRFEDINSSNIGKHNRENYGGFLEYRTVNIPRTSLNVGTYINYNTKYGWQVYPGIDFGYNVSKDLRLVINSGTSQRIPSFTDLYLDQKPGNIGNPDLVTEDSWQIEGLVKYIYKDLHIQGGYFYRKIDNYVDWMREQENVPYQPLNVGENKVHGLNASLEQKRGYFHWKLAYTYLDAAIHHKEVSGMSKSALYNLKHQTILRTGYRKDALNFILSNRLQKRVVAKSYLLSDARTSYTWNRLETYVDVQNLWDKKIVDASAVPMSGRWYTFGITYGYAR